MSVPCLKESEEASILVAWLRIHNIKFHHSPNETGHTPEAKRRAIRMKREGTSKGYPDYTILVGGHIIFIELKRLRGSTTSPEQHAWVQALNEIDNCQAFIVKGGDAAVKLIEQYLPVTSNTTF